MTLKERSGETEIMDDLGISGEVVHQTLRELNTINRFLGGNQVSVSAYKKMAKGRKEISLIDLGCGGGDIMMEMARWPGKKNIRAAFLGIDANQNITEYAEQNTKEYPEIRFEAINIFSDEFRKMKTDIIHCCLFTHHFSEEQLIELFRQWRAQANLGVIINDLHRHPIAWWSIKILTRIFSKSEMVRNDAAVSVARGFKRRELLRILEKAGITEFDLSWKWAFRWKLIF